MTAPRTPRPVTEDDYTQVRELHSQGLGRNDIARALDRSGQVISRLAKEQGLTFTRGPEVAAATEARQVDLAARRTKLAEQLQDDAERLRAQLWVPCTVGQFGGKDNEWNDVRLDRPQFADQKTILAAVSIAVDKSAKLSPPETDTEGLAAVDAWLKGMMGG